MSRIIVNYVNPPIPDRNFDYCAYDDATFEPGSPQGYGPTKEAALADLQDKMEELNHD